MSTAAARPKAREQTLLRSCAPLQGDTLRRSSTDPAPKSPRSPPQQAAGTHQQQPLLLPCPACCWRMHSTEATSGRGDTNHQWPTVKYTPAAATLQPRALPKRCPIRPATPLCHRQQRPQQLQKPPRQVTAPQRTSHHCCCRSCCPGPRGGAPKQAAVRTSSLNEEQLLIPCPA